MAICIQQITSSAMCAMEKLVGGFAVLLKNGARQTHCPVNRLPHETQLNGLRLDNQELSG